MEKVIVGSEEWFGFPELALPAVKARVDSGAKTSSIHAENIQQFVRDNQPWVSFDLYPLQNDRRSIVRAQAQVVDKRFVKSSNGDKERRYVIRTPMSFAGLAYEVELTLTNRDSMGYRMLLGREAMQGRMLVDPSGHFLLGEHSAEELKNFYPKENSTDGGLKIGLFASNPDLYSNQRLVEVGRERGHTVKFYNIRHCYMKLDAVNPEVHYRGGHILNDLDAVIPRIRPSMTFYGSALMRQFESIGIYVQNSASAITASRDKLYSLQMLLKNGLDIPISGFANSPIDTENLIDMVNGAPLIVKLLEGTQGRGVVLGETRKAAESVINAFKSLKANLLVQEFVKEANGEDLRLFVIRSKVVASMQRKAAAGEFRANVHRGGSTMKIRVTPTERKLAVKAVKVLGLDVAGVDIIRSKNGPLLLEVNSSPGLEGIEEVTGVDIAGEMIKAIEQKLKWSPE